jgi:hypothetical protein
MMNVVSFREFTITNHWYVRCTPLLTALADCPLPRLMITAMVMFFVLIFALMVKKDEHPTNIYHIPPHRLHCGRGLYHRRGLRVLLRQWCGRAHPAGSGSHSAGVLLTDGLPPGREREIFYVREGHHYHFSDFYRSAMVVLPPMVVFALVVRTIQGPCSRIWRQAGCIISY